MEEYIVTKVLTYKVTAPNQVTALNSPTPEGSEVKVGVRKIQPWEGNEELPYWHVAVEDLSIQAPSDNEAATLAHEMNGTHEAEFKTLYAVSQND